MSNYTSNKIINTRNQAVKNNEQDIQPVNLNKTIKHLQQSLTDSQRKAIMTSLRHKAYLGLQSYDDENNMQLYLYKSIELYKKDRQIALECIKNNRQVPSDVEHRLLAEKEARRQVRLKEQEEFEKTLPEYLRGRK